MESGKNHSKPAIGFLTVIEHPQHGLFGGYLVLNLAGRPLEFHCTAPIKPNRAQQILYGPTLESFLYGEQIGSTLLGHAKTAPLVVCTDCEPVLSLRDLVDVPVALVLPPGALQEPDGTGSEAHPTPAVEIAVIDRGVGIEPQQRDSIFNPFFTTKPEGVGLGLAIVSKIVDEHGGKITVESEPGKGSVFHVLLPASSPSALTGSA